MSDTKVWDPSNVKIKRQLSDSFRPEEGTVYLFQFLSRVFPDPNRSNETSMGAPNVARVLNLQDGRELSIILATIPQKRLAENYPDDSFIGACFRYVQHPKRASKRYRDYDMDEIDGTTSPHFRDLKQVKAEAGNYGPLKAKQGKK